MSSPGSGKTSSILQLIKRLKDDFRIGVLEADIDGDVDTRTMLNAGVASVQIHTGGMCHLDADMSRQSLKEIGSKDLDLVILENVGNLVCPAEFDTGAVKDLVILSVPEGDDKPLKYPLMFTKADVVLVNKIDALEAFDFDLEKFTENVRMRNANADVIAVSAETGEGFDEAAAWIRNAANEFLGGAK
jgi:hydrogenase nickel incorporation protein HypB